MTDNNIIKKTQKEQININKPLKSKTTLQRQSSKVRKDDCKTPLFKNMNNMPKKKFTKPDLKSATKLAMTDQKMRASEEQAPTQVIARTSRIPINKPKRSTVNHNCTYQNNRRSTVRHAHKKLLEQVLVSKKELVNSFHLRTVSNKNKAHWKKTKAPKPSIKVYFLGGLNEIGKNFTVFESENDMLIVDCGMTFPEGEMLRFDLVIPDFTFVEQNIHKIKGIILTHGHEDHIGSLPYLLKKVQIPIYGTSLTLGLVAGKLKEHNLYNRNILRVVKPGQIVQLGSIAAEFIHVNHSIPNAVAFALHAAAGIIIHTGDFKIDCTPAKESMIDLARFAELGKEGVLALLADSTNAERSGYTATEHKIESSFEALFQQAENQRIIIATFASNINRVQQIVNCAVQTGRKVALSGRSMINATSIAMELGYLNVPDDVLIDIDLLGRYPKKKTVLVTTGSQGETMSALTRMAFAKHRKVEVGPSDCIIISAKPIPGNEKMVGAVINELLKRGCKVIYESMYEVHVSGHAYQEELKIIHGLVRPKYFLPIHGEQRHLRKHADLAISMGMNPKNIQIADIGSCVELNPDYMKTLDNVPAGRVLVDGLGVGDVGNIVLRDRKRLAEDGLIIVVCTLHAQTRSIVSGPDFISRGFVYVRESESFIDEAKKLVFNILETSANEHMHDWGILKNNIKDALYCLLYKKTKRSPMILPILIEV